MRSLLCHWETLCTASCRSDDLFVGVRVSYIPLSKPLRNTQRLLTYRHSFLSCFWSLLLLAFTRVDRSSLLILVSREATALSISGFFLQSECVSSVRDQTTVDKSLTFTPQVSKKFTRPLGRAGHALLGGASTYTSSLLDTMHHSVLVTTGVFQADTVKSRQPRQRTFECR